MPIFARKPPSELLAKAMFAPPSISLRLARPQDAEFIYSLRVDERLNQHISQAPDSVQAQRAYLESYLQRENSGIELYFIIQNKKTGRACGTVRIYDLQKSSFCWGSWMLDQNKSRFAAIESAIFIYEVGFGLLKYCKSHFDVRKENSGVISFHERFGAQRVREGVDDVFFEITREDFLDRLDALVELTRYQPLFLQQLGANATPKQTLEVQRGS